MQNYYIAANGIAGQSGTSPLAPWPMTKPLGFTFAPGDHILLNRADKFIGTFGFTSLNGTLANPIVIDFYGNGPNPILDGGGSAVAGVLSFSNCHFVTINNIVVQNGIDGGGLIVLQNGCTDITINNIYANGGIRGVKVLRCGAAGVANIKILNSFFENITDPGFKYGGGSHVQFDNCNGAGMEVGGNKCYINLAGQPGSNAYVGDVLSFYQSNGVAGSYILVHDNRIRGGGSQIYGKAGIILGDVGGSYQRAYNNLLVNTGTGGIQAEAGTFIIIEDNKIYGRYFDYSLGMGIGVSNFSGQPMNNITVQRNIINWTNNNNGTGAPGSPVIANKNIYRQGASTSTGQSGGAPIATPTGWSTNSADTFADPGAFDAMIADPLWDASNPPWEFASTGLLFNPLVSRIYGVTDFDPGATSPNAIIYTSSNPAVATIVSNQVHVVGAGATAITANDGTTTIIQNLIVNKAQLTVTANNTSKNYGAVNPSLSAVITGFVNGDTSSVLTTAPLMTTAALTGSATGTYPISGSGAVASNYNFVYVAASLTINKLVLMVTADNKSRNYGTANPALTVSITGFIGGESASNLLGQPGASTGATASSTVGTYPINAFGGSAANYTFSYVAGSITINKVTLTITADSKTKYAGIPNPPLTETITGFVNGDTVNNLATPPTLSTTANTGSPAGSYPITASGAVSSNYTFNYVAGSITITNAVITFGALANKTYGGADFDPGASSVLAITYTSSNTAVATIVGNKIHIIGAGTTNITATNASGNVVQPLTVNKVVLTITADNKISVAGSAIPALTASYTGFVMGDDHTALGTQPTLSTSANSGSPAGDYSIVPSGAASNNYSFTYINGTLSLTSSALITFSQPIIILP